MSMDRLIEKIIVKGNPTVVGLDPNLKNIPPYLLEKHVKEHGETLKAAAEAIYEFNVGLIDALYGIVPAVKPQSAYYEMYGVEGINALKRTMDYAKSKGMYVILDVKRGDIGSTASAYADAYLGSVKVGETVIEPFAADCITVNGYLGSDGVLPFVERCKENGKSIFVLVKTSNPSSNELQDLVAGTRTIYQVMAEKTNLWGEDLVGKNGYSDVGFVVGATHPTQLLELRRAHPRQFFLVPGYGAQGATARDLAGAFDRRGLGAIVNSSRGIIFAWQKTDCKTGENFAEAAYDAAVAMRDDLKRYC
ncbi:MAG: orotidine-5'-phosphate decarboxylase [Ruminococcaceae bacterium]|nr:orotidine-5'-phosphate decarboxylase [Oscillospiraceae bacterium]